MGMSISECKRAAAARLRKNEYFSLHSSKVSSGRQIRSVRFRMGRNFFKNDFAASQTKIDLSLPLSPMHRAINIELTSGFSQHPGQTCGIQVRHRRVVLRRSHNLRVRHNSLRLGLSSDLFFFSKSFAKPKLPSRGKLVHWRMEYQFTHLLTSMQFLKLRILQKSQLASM